MLGPGGGRGRGAAALRAETRHILLLAAGAGGEGKMSEVKLQPGPGVAEVAEVDSVDSLQPLWLRFVTTLSTDHLTAPPPALTLTPLPPAPDTGWRWSCDSCEHCTLSQAARPTPPRPARPNTAQPPSLQQYWQHRHQDPGHRAMGTPVISVISCIALLFMHIPSQPPLCCPL